LDVFKQRTKSRAEFTLVETDAAEYEFRPDETVFFFFNPFRRLVMEKVLQNIQNSIHLHPRPVWVILNRAVELEPAVENHPNFKEVAAHAHGNSRFRVYSNDKAAAEVCSTSFRAIERLARALKVRNTVHRTL
jgi:hypothetical protein